MKKIFSFILSAVLILFICPASIAFEADPIMDFERVAAVRENAEAFLNASGYQNTIDSPVPMYNFNEEIETLYFPLLPKGFLIASYKDGHVIEFSPDRDAVACENVLGTLYYNGIMEYYESANSSEVIHILSKNLVKKEALQASFDKQSLAHIPSLNYQTPAIAYALEPNNPTPINWAPNSSSYYCVITSISNLLQYYHDFMKADVYAEYVNSVSALRKYLKDEKYIFGDDGTTYGIVADRHNYGGTIYSGLRAYFKRSDVDTFNVNVSGKSTVSDVKIQLKDYARPILISIQSSLIQPDLETRHSIMVYTYYETADTTYLIANDTLGSNYFHVCVDDLDPTFRTMYLS